MFFSQKTKEFRGYTEIGSNHILGKPLLHISVPGNECTVAQVCVETHIFYRSFLQRDIGALDLQTEKIG